MGPRGRLRLKPSLYHSLATAPAFGARRLCILLNVERHDGYNCAPRSMCAARSMCDVGWSVICCICCSSSRRWPSAQAWNEAVDEQQGHLGESGTVWSFDDDERQTDGGFVVVMLGEACMRRLYAEIIITQMNCDASHGL